MELIIYINILLLWGGELMMIKWSIILGLQWLGNRLSNLLDVYRQDLAACLTSKGKISHAGQMITEASSDRPLRLEDQKKTEFAHASSQNFQPFFYHCCAYVKNKRGMFNCTSAYLKNRKAILNARV